MKASNYNILSFIYGSQIFEAYTLDLLLSALADGVPHSYAAFTSNSHINTWEISRKSEKLIDDGFVKILGDNVLITSKGMIHLSKGGYVGEIKAHKRISFSFWLSIFAVVVSVASAVFNWFNR